MDYEKKYKEALGWIKSLYNGLHGKTKEDAEHYFPELNESEDEKMRAMAIKAVYSPEAQSCIKSCGINPDDVIAWLEKQGAPQDKGELSDGYHTFNELYYYRMLYNAAFFNMLPKEWVHKSKKHHDGEECFGDGWFIVMANLPTGQISNHYELKDWNLFQIPEKEVADKWDGHTPQEAADRLHKYLLEKQDEQKNEEMPALVCPKCMKSFEKCEDYSTYHNRIRYICPHCEYDGDSVEFETSYKNHPIHSVIPSMIQWKGNNLKQVIEFTGKSPKFNEWFKSFEEYETYVHEHNNIFKLFNEDGSNYEVPVGAWIVKTPDGYNVASKAIFKQISTWSEEDENLLNRLIGVLDGTNKEDYHEGWEEKFLPWLKSIKDRVQPQHEQELNEKNIADVFEKVGLAKIVREQGYDALTGAVQSAMIELSKFTPQPKENIDKPFESEWIDLGLPSGTLWKSSNEEGFYTYDKAVETFGDQLPTKEQFIELKSLCRWKWRRNGYKVTGPNGNDIFLSASGYRSCYGNVFTVGTYGYYWSSTPYDSKDAWFLNFYFSGVYMDSNIRCYERSVRLVKNK